MTRAEVEVALTVQRAVRENMERNKVKLDREYVEWLAAEVAQDVTYHLSQRGLIRTEVDVPTLGGPTSLVLEEVGAKAHAYTRHGHSCCPAAGKRPEGMSIARCGGRALCRVCSADAREIHEGIRTP